MSVFPILNVSEISRCVTESLAQSGDATDVRLAKVIRRTQQRPVRDREGSLARITPDWQERVGAAALACRERAVDVACGD